MLKPIKKWYDTIPVGFHRPTGAACSRRPLCTRAKAAPREITLRPRPLHEALQNVRGRQETDAWRTQYGKRAGVEGTLSQAVRAFGLCQRIAGGGSTLLCTVNTINATDPVPLVSTPFTD
ncbi:MAG: transposase [Candidatus Competibacteraceae bacterium]